MKRWKKVVIWFLSIIVVLGIGGVITANYAINKFMDSMASSLEQELTESVANAAGDEEASASTNGSDTKTAAGNTDTDAATGDDVGDGDAASTGGAASGSAGADQSTGTKETTSGSKDDYKPDVSAGDMLEIKDKVTVSDKVDVTKIVMGSLSLSDMKKLQGLASGGMTIEKKREARKILLDKVSPEDYDKLSQIAKKYGASEGRSYEEAQKSEDRLQKKDEQAQQENVIAE